MNSAASILVFCPHHAPALWCAYFTTHLPQRLDGLYHQPALPILLCHCIGQSLKGGTGISTCCPSPTAFALSLGPDLPWEDCPSPGNLRLSTAKVLASLSLLMPAFSLVYSPPTLPVWLLPSTHCSSTARRCGFCFRRHAFAFGDLLAFGENMSSQLQKSQRRTHRFGVTFEPRTSSAHNHSTSELLRTL